MYNSANLEGPSKEALHTQLVIMLKHWCFFFFLNEYYSVQARFFMEQRPEFSNFGWPYYLFYLQKLPDPPPSPRNQMIVPKITQEINKPSNAMAGVKITVTYCGQNNRIFGNFFLVDFLFSSLKTPNVFIVMVLKCTY